MMQSECLHVSTLLSTQRDAIDGRGLSSEVHVDDGALQF